MLASDDGYGAIGAMAVASLAYLQVSIVTRRGEHTLTVACHLHVLAEFFYQVLIVELSIIFVYLRYLLLQLLAVALRETSHHIQFLEFAVLFGFCKLKYGVDALLLCVSDEATGVYHSNLALRTFGVVGAMVARLFKQTHERLAVDEVFRASHRYYIYVSCLHVLLVFKE